MNLGKPLCENLDCMRNVDETVGVGKWCDEHSPFLTKVFVRGTIIDRLEGWESVTDTDNPVTIAAIKDELLEWLGL